MLNPFGEIKKKVDAEVLRAHDIGYNKGWKDCFTEAFERGREFERSKHEGVITGISPKVKAQIEELMGGK